MPASRNPVPAYNFRQLVYDDKDLYQLGMATRAVDFDFDEDKWPEDGKPFAAIFSKNVGRTLSTEYSPHDLYHDLYRRLAKSKTDESSLLEIVQQFGYINKPFRLVTNSRVDIPDMSSGSFVRAIEHTIGQRIKDLRYTVDGLRRAVRIMDELDKFNLKEEVNELENLFQGGQGSWVYYYDYPNTSRIPAQYQDAKNIQEVAIVQFLSQVNKNLVGAISPKLLLPQDADASDPFQVKPSLFLSHVDLAGVAWLQLGQVFARQRNLFRCPKCGVIFSRHLKHGRKRVYCDDNCKKQASRDRLSQPGRRAQSVPNGSRRARDEKVQK